jgi:WD40 repeat protein
VEQPHLPNPYTTSHQVAFQGPPSLVKALLWTPDGSRLYTAHDDQTVRYWAAGSSQTLTLLERQAFPISSLVWSKEVERGVVACGKDGQMVHVWAVSGQRKIFSREHHTQNVCVLALSPDGAHLALEGEGAHVHICSLYAEQKTPRPYNGHSGSLRHLAWSYDGELLATADEQKALHAWIREGHEEDTAHVYRGHTQAHSSQDREEPPLQGISALACAPKEYRIASAGEENHQIHIWNRYADKQLIYKGHTALVLAIAWSPDGSYIASASEDGTIHVWETRHGRQTFLFTEHQQATTHLAWSPDGRRVASASKDLSIRIWTPHRVQVN